jgi:hypothetical protein
MSLPRSAFKKGQLTKTSTAAHLAMHSTRESRSRGGRHSAHLQGYHDIKPMPGVCDLCRAEILRSTSLGRD